MCKQSRDEHLARVTSEVNTLSCFAFSDDSFIIRGFGWDAWVVVGLVDTKTATMDQSNLSEVGGKISVILGMTLT